MSTEALERSYQHCRIVARTQARNFYYSFVLLSKPQRDAMCAIYAFMRYCDDLSDGPDTANLMSRRNGARSWMRLCKDPMGSIHAGRHFTMPCAATKFQPNISIR